MLLVSAPFGAPLIAAVSGAARLRCGHLEELLVFLPPLFEPLFPEEPDLSPLLALPLLVDDPESAPPEDDFEDESLEPSDPSLFAKFFLLPDLKSVSYQPPPFNRNPAAEISLVSELLPHSGHFLRGFSLIFCNASNWCPHFSHWYS